MRFYYRPGHPRADDLGFVSADDLSEIPMEPPRALNAPVMVDRFYEGARATDGTDIGSRAKHREYMKSHGVAPAGDFSPSWYEAQRKQREAAAARERRETVGRIVYEKFKP